MCFSATGSFVGAGVLGGIGLVALSSNKSAPHRMFAAIPLLFSVQQCAEGVVWLTMQRPEARWAQHLGVNVFLAFALVVWPLWLPQALRHVERTPERRRMLRWLQYAGIAVATCSAVLLVRWQPVAQMAGHSIRYVYPLDDLARVPGLLLAAYAIPTVLPFFVSTTSLARTTGVALVLSLVAAIFIERDALTSVWCFFAAILSGLVLGAILLEQRFTTQPQVLPIAT